MNMGFEGVGIVECGWRNDDFAARANQTRVKGAWPMMQAPDHNCSRGTFIKIRIHCIASADWSPRIFKVLVRLIWKAI